MGALRLNVMADDELRVGIMRMAKGILREIADSAIADTIKIESWIQKRVDGYFAKVSFVDTVKSSLRDLLNEPHYGRSPEILKIINDVVEARAHRAMSELHIKYESKIKEMVGAELRRRMQSLG